VKGNNLASLGDPLHWAVRSDSGDNQQPGMGDGRVETLGFEYGEGFLSLNIGS
jgi:hypothetical protein